MVSFFVIQKVTTSRFDRSRLTFFEYVTLGWHLTVRRDSILKIGVPSLILICSNLWYASSSLPNNHAFFVFLFCNTICKLMIFRFIPRSKNITDKNFIIFPDQKLYKKSNNSNSDRALRYSPSKLGDGER